VNPGLPAPSEESDSPKAEAAEEQEEPALDEAEKETVAS
jgi:hypothetical protein